jgi:hypothetical protein
MKKMKTGHENKGVLELKTSYLSCTVDERNWFLITPILLSLNARAEAVDAAALDVATDALEVILFEECSSQKKDVESESDAENRFQIQNRAIAGKRTVELSTAATLFTTDNREREKIDLQENTVKLL